jgi:hypothetical protein
MHPGFEAAKRILGEKSARRLIFDTPWSIAEKHFV